MSANEIRSTLKSMRNEQELNINGHHVICCYDATAWSIGERLATSLEEAMEIVSH